MKLTFIIEGRMTAAGAGPGRFYNRLSDADGNVIVFEEYKDAVKRCEELNSRIANRNLRYSVVHRVTSYHGTPWPNQKAE